MKEIITSICIVCLLVVFMIACIDREIARRDYLKIASGNLALKSVQDCIFDANCNYYNNLLKGE